MDFGARRVAAVSLVVDPASRSRVDPALVASALGLTPTESKVAVMLSEGRTAREIAVETGRQEGSVYMVIKRAYKKLDVCRQVDLVRLVLSLADMSDPRR